MLDCPYRQPGNNETIIRGFMGMRGEWADKTTGPEVIVKPSPLKERPTVLPTNSAARKQIPMATGCLDYFPAALAAVAALSKIGNDQHNPGEPLHWAREKSTDHADTLMRHLTERGTFDVDNVRHSTKVAWRALALLQVELEAAGLPVEPPRQVVDSVKNFME